VSKRQAETSDQLRRAISCSTWSSNPQARAMPVQSAAIAARVPVSIARWCSKVAACRPGPRYSNASALH